MRRRSFSFSLLALASSTGVMAAEADATSQLQMVSAGPGSAFLPYASAIAGLLNRAGPARVELRETKGSIENVGLIERSPANFGTVFLGSAYEAVHGIGFAAGRPHTQLRALFPMYETSFQIVALRSTNVSQVRDLDGRRVGVGPAGGPAEAYFRALSAVAAIKPVFVNGSPAEHVAQIAKSEIDAMWQGAIVPVPSLVDALSKAEAHAFGLSAQEVSGMRERFPFMAEVVVKAGTYVGQKNDLRSIAAWNFVLCHAALPDAVAYAITKAVLAAEDLPARLGPSAVGTRASNVRFNKAVPFHPGAERYYREAGVDVQS